MKRYPRSDAALIEKNVPADLRQLAQWVCWRLVDRDKDKPAKLPVDPGTGREASVTKPATWSSFDTALARFKADQALAGVGFVFTPTDPYTGVDVDDCYDPSKRELGPWADAIVKSLNSYAELSPSGTGVKIILRGEAPGALTRRAKIEIYSHWRYFTITGQLLPGVPRTIESRQGQLADLYAEVFGAQPEEKKNADRPRRPERDPKLERVRRIADDELLAKARAAANGDKFARLWDGDLHDHGGDRSRADASLCAILCYWTRSDAPRIDRLFRLSKLYRKKWDERRGERTYGQRTVDAAMGATTAYFDPDLDAALGVRHNDVSNAEIFVQLQGGDLRHCRAWKSWLRWDEHHWERDADAQARIALEAVSEELIRRAANVDGDRRKIEMLWAVKAGDVHRMNAIETIASARLAVGAHQLDRDPWSLVCANGVLDLREGTLHDGRRDEWLTRSTGVRYDPKAKCPVFEKFLREVMGGSAEMVDYLWRVLGYALTGDTTERTFFLLHGYGRNGKTTFVETLRALLGTGGRGYAQKAKFTTFLRKNVAGSGANDDIAHLAGARAVIASEADSATPLDTATVKELTGSDAIRARHLYGREFEFTPQFKLFLVTNHVPPIHESTYSIWDRLHYIPFDYRVPEDKVDRRLPLKLLGELEGILAKAVTACREWQKEGLGPPEKVLKAGADLKVNMDTIGEFIAERCLISVQSELETGGTGTKKDGTGTENHRFRAPHGALYDDFSRWAKENGLRFYPSSKSLGAYLREKGFIEKRGSQGAKFWLGIGLKEDTGAAEL